MSMCRCDKPNEEWCPIHGQRIKSKEDVAKSESDLGALERTNGTARLSPKHLKAFGKDYDPDGPELDCPMCGTYGSCDCESSLL